MFSVRPTTIARWAREGKLKAFYTPGGHRRYNYSDIRQILPPAEPTPEDPMITDAVRLYDQGWNVRQVADRFGYSYGAMRRLLKANTTLRERGSTSSNPFPLERQD